MKKRNPPADVIKAIKKSAREEFGIQPTKVQESKKAYNRKKLNKKINTEEDE